MLNGILGNYNLPDVAQEALAKRGLKAVPLDAEGTSRLVSEHDKGLPFRFDKIEVPSPEKTRLSKVAGYNRPITTTVEVIYWHKDKFHRAIVARVLDLPEELLDVSDPDEPRGRYAEAYKRWKTGQNAPGTSLVKWGQLADGDAASLAMLGVFSVEQFASKPESWLQGKFPKTMFDAHEAAQAFVANKDSVAEQSKQTIVITELQKKLEQLEARLADREAKPAAKKKNSKAKSKVARVVDGVIVEGE